MKDTGLALFLCLFSKVPGIWQRCFAAVLWEIYTLRNIGWSTASALLWPYRRNAPVQVKPAGVGELPLLLCHATISTQRENLHSGRHNLCHTQRSVEDCECPFPRALITCLPPNSSVQFSRSVVSNSIWPHGLQHARPPCPSPTPGVYSNSCPLSQ